MPTSIRRFIEGSGFFVLLTLLLSTSAGSTLAAPQDEGALPAPVVMTTQQDHQRTMDLLQITSLRRGADGRNPEAPNAANYDESKANPYPKLPNPLILKNGKKVTTKKAWWNERRQEIVEDFDKEIYGRAPANTPKVNWEVTRTIREEKDDVPVVTKQLVGHVDNSSYPLIAVEIQLTLTTPANAAGPVPVIMEFSFGGQRRNVTGNPPAGGAPGVSAQASGGPSWQQQALARGWGYATLIPTI